MAVHYQVSQEHRNVIYPIEMPAFDPIFAEKMASDGFVPKDEFHITVIPAEHGRKLNDAKFAELTQYFTDRTHEEPEIWYHDQVVRLSKPKLVDEQEYPRESLVVPVGSVALLRVLLDVNLRFNLSMPRQYPHVTVAYQPDTPIAARGIGIASEAEFLSMEHSFYSEYWRAAGESRSVG